MDGITLIVNNPKPKMKTQENPVIDVGALKLLAYYLSGVKDGRGDLLPLGSNVIDELFNAIRYIENQRK